MSSFRSAITFVRPALVCRSGGAPTRCSQVWDNTPAAVSISLPRLPLLDSAGRLSVGDRLGPRTAGLQAGYSGVHSERRRP